MAAPLALIPLLLHLPSMSGDTYGSVDDAFPILDVDKSIVLYDRVSCDVPQLWMEFDAGQSDNLFFQLGVPEIDRLADYRPSIAIVAPGIASQDPVPFAVPEGMGVRLYDTSALTADDLGYFDEPFTNTQSWLLVETTLAIPGDGPGYVVAWDPGNTTGKLWVAVGTVEDFSGGIDTSFAQIWSFHETNGYAPEETPVEQQCEVEPEPEPGEEETGDADDGETDGTGETDAGDPDDAGEETGDAETDMDDPGLETEGDGCACDVGDRPSPAGLALFALVPWLRRRRRP